MAVHSGFSSPPRPDDRPLPDAVRSAPRLANRRIHVTTATTRTTAATQYALLTFAGALAQVIAGGEVIAGGTGGYGPITSRSRHAQRPLGVVIFSNYQVAVNAPERRSCFRGLTIDGRAPWPAASSL